MLLGHYLKRGLSKAEIAQEIGVSRRTVHHWIATAQFERELDEVPVRYAPRPPVTRKIAICRVPRAVPGTTDGRLTRWTLRLTTVLSHRLRFTKGDFGCF